MLPLISNRDSCSYTQWEIKSPILKFFCQPSFVKLSKKIDKRSKKFKVADMVTSGSQETEMLTDLTREIRRLNSNGMDQPAEEQLVQFWL